MNLAAQIAQIAANLATALGIVTALIVAYLSLRRHRAEERRHRADEAHKRWLDAKSLYQSVLNDQIANPQFRGDRWEEATLNADERFRYSTFVNKLLWSLEGMIAVDSPEEEWRRSAEHIAGNYRSYLASDDFRAEAMLFSEKLRAAIQTGAGLTYREVAPLPAIAVAEVGADDDRSTLPACRFQNSG